EEDRLALLGGELPRLPQVRQPGDLGPLVFALVGFDQGLEVVELIGADRLGSRRGQIGRGQDQAAPHEAASCRYQRRTSAVFRFEERGQTTGVAYRKRGGE